MLEPRGSRFWLAALQSGLADEPSLRACWDAIPQEKRTPEHIDRRLAKQAVQAGLLTVWQAQQLLAGRSTGFKIDRYTLLQLIGQGGMGRVYLARDTRLNRRVAVKILSPERVNNPRAIARFHREALVGAQLQHENLVRIYDEGEAGGKCYLVMEYIEGKNIGQMIAESGPLPPPVAARLCRQVALGLEHAQRKGLIHRDVNPYNILVTRDGVAKLTDLGLAIDLGDTDRVTRDGATVGTFDYVSPEQARHSHSVDTRSDIYSLGCTLYHMLTGRVPFPSASLPEKLFGHQASNPEPVRDLAPGVPEGLAEVLARTMRKAPDDRYATPLELAQALEPYADDGVAPGANGDATPPVSRAGVAPRAGVEATVTRQFATPVVSPGSSAVPVPIPPPTIADPTPPADTPPDLGIDLGAPAPAPLRAAPAAKAPAPKPAAAADPLGLGIDLGAPAPAPLRAAPAAKAPAPKPAAAADPLGLGIDLGAPAPAAKSAPAARPAVNAADPPPGPPAADPLGLGIDFGAPAAKSAPAAPAAKAAPAALPAVAPPATPPADDPLGLGINLGAPAPSALAKAAPAAKAAEPAAAEAPEFAGDPLGLGINLGAPTSPVAPVAVAVTVSEPTATGASAEAPVGGGVFGLGVDVGPEQPLSRGAAPVKVKAKAPGDGSGTGGGGPVGRWPRWAVPAVAAAGLVVLAGGAAVGYRHFVGKDTQAVVPKAGAGKATGAGKTVAAVPVGTAPPKAAVTGQDVVVVGSDGMMEVMPDLRNAIRAAIGSRGHVLLRNREPLTLKSADALRAAGGVLAIRAGAGVKPVLRVEVKGGTPFLSTRSDAPLTMEGVTIEVTVVEPGADPAPVIEAGGGVTLDRCAFRVVGPAAKSRAVVVEGSKLTATGCWFENFDRALDVAYYAGMEAKVSQCMFVHPAGDAGTAAVRLRSMPGGFAKTGRRLTVNRCTVRGGGFLEFSGFAPSGPINVAVTGCAAVVDTLARWEPGGDEGADPKTMGGGTFGRAALVWSGRDNAYEVGDKAGWARLVPSKGAAAVPLPDGPTDLAGWVRGVGPEADPAATPVRFVTDPSARSDRPGPVDFAIADTGVRPLGADPAYVGPGARAGGK